MITSTSKRHVLRNSHLNMHVIGTRLGQYFLIALFIFGLISLIAIQGYSYAYQNTPKGSGSIDVRHNDATRSNVNFDFSRIFPSEANVSTYVRPDLETALHQPINICDALPRIKRIISAENNNTSNEVTNCVLLLVVVHSATRNFASRKIIRETWGNVSRFYNATHRPRVIFSLGLPGSVSDRVALQRSIDKESETYGDILQESFVDSYLNLTTKTVCSFKWIVKNYPSVPYILKTDDDVFINVQNALNYVKKQNVASEKVLTGYTCRRMKPVRIQNSRWYTSIEAYPYEVYPTYLAGTGYLLSNDVLRKLYFIALTMHVEPLEDVFITGICANMGKINVRFSGIFDPENRATDVCSYVMYILSHHRANIRKVYISPEDTVKYLKKCRIKFEKHIPFIKGYNKNTNNLLKIKLVE